ncbi:DoxX family protein [Pseudoalteromonas byunsanensis]|uniref:DoxX family protein n=1 Tax=Pseudoalteromonas byunsanensis TaxID=327939 RepID=A0A1S1N2V5_9GAMM|nr:DoxX family protein [Pseudoalteromonas byunsanensis]OHU93635.1 hypothetical protein BIW53_20065 [Pseudoalteromonas byunsanensis]
MNMINPLTNNTLFANVSVLLARFGLSAIFIMAGLNKIQQYDGSAQYMASVGLPGELLPLVIALEVIGGLFILIGLLNQITALALALFCVVSAILFHANFADQMQFIMFFKNIAMAGGFLVLAAHGAGQWSVDQVITNKSNN